jgi:hypothetical protein
MEEDPIEGTHQRMTAAEAQKLTKSVYLTREEAAKYLGLSSKTLAQNKHTGPDYYKFFGRVLYKLSDLENWARQQKETRRQGWYPTVDRTYRAD